MINRTINSDKMDTNSLVVKLWKAVYLLVSVYAVNKKGWKRKRRENISGCLELAFKVRNSGPNTLH